MLNINLNMHVENQDFIFQTSFFTPNNNLPKFVSGAQWLDEIRKKMYLNVSYTCHVALPLLSIHTENVSFLADCS